MTTIPDVSEVRAALILLLTMMVSDAAEPRAKGEVLDSLDMRADAHAALAAGGQLAHWLVRYVAEQTGKEPTAVIEQMASEMTGVEVPHDNGVVAVEWVEFLRARLDEEARRAEEDAESSVAAVAGYARSVLDRVESGRRLIAEYERAAVFPQSEFGTFGDGYRAGLEKAVKDLAQGYASHSEFPGSR
ncbi:DUF6221 family protein [Spirillospora sp. NPDC127200]